MSTLIGEGYEQLIAPHLCTYHAGHLHKLDHFSRPCPLSPRDTAPVPPARTTHSVYRSGGDQTAQDTEHRCAETSWVGAHGVRVVVCDPPSQIMSAQVVRSWHDWRRVEIPGRRTRRDRRACGRWARRHRMPCSVLRCCSVPRSRHHEVMRREPFQHTGKNSCFF